jgi:methyl-accepting chemotaxis protein
MTQLLQGNPELWKIAGDLFVKNMDWPGAQEMSKRLAKSIDPKFLANEDDPALQAAQQQMQAMGQEMEQMHQMIQGMVKSMEAQELEIKQFEANIRAYDAETKRIAATSAGMTPEQIQDIVMGVLDAAKDSGDLLHSGMMQMEQAIDLEGQPQPQQPAPDMGMPPEQM